VLTRVHVSLCKSKGPTTTYPYVPKPSQQQANLATCTQEWRSNSLACAATFWSPMPSPRWMSACCSTGSWGSSESQTHSQTCTRDTQQR
jgi:hypothetical protein